MTGLLHTFEGGCNADPVHGGDYVADTPAQASTNYSDCTLGRDSCPTLAGRDPIFNHMSYSYVYSNFLCTWTLLMESKGAAATGTSLMTRVCACSKFFPVVDASPSLTLESATSGTTTVLDMSKARVSLL